MTWEEHPVTPDRFENLADVINRNRRADACWCLSHRLGLAEIRELGGCDIGARADIPPSSARA